MMRKAISLLLMGLLLYSCAAYKQLKPVPEINPIEDGFIQIKKEDKNFKLKKDKKYYMVFPPATQENMFLVLDIKQKDAFHSYLTETFDQGKGRIVEVPDQSPEPDHLMVFPIAPDVPRYYWVIDLVKRDVVLEMSYRYVARWRFAFERKYEAFLQTLQENTVDRSPYKALGIAILPEDLKFAKEISSIKAKNARLKTLQEELKKIEDIFPVNIRNTNDEAYQNYLALKEKLNDELTFQKRYLQVLELLNNEQKTRGNTAEFLKMLPQFSAFFDQRDQFPSNVIMAVHDVLAKRLVEIVPYYKQKLRVKRDATKIETVIPQLETLLPKAGLLMSKDLKQLGKFVRAYNALVDDVWKIKKNIQGIKDRVRRQKQMPSNSFFSDIVTQLSKMLYTMPRTNIPALQPYKNYTCVRALQKEIDNVRAQINTLLTKYRRADALVPEINILKERNDLHGILSLLKKNRDLDFLLPLYQKLDKESLDKQAQTIKAAIANDNFAEAETALRALFNDRDFINYAGIKAQKMALVRQLGNALVEKIVGQSRLRARQFVDENINTVQNVESLYDSEAFQPVYQMSFFPDKKTQADYQALLGELEHLKNIVFPQKAIKNLYKQLIANPDDQGVLKARAVVVHGRHYRGDDITIKNRVAECDPQIPKLLTRPRKYRRIFALPVTNNPTGTNTYLFKVNLKIPSPAQFPVFDVYIRLPKNLAKQAGKKQWYEKITFNGKVIKNEGRFTITAPGPENNYECQVGPLQIVKTSNNILEVRFKKGAFKLYQISVMAQKPIIKKH